MRPAAAHGLPTGNGYRIAYDLKRLNGQVDALPVFLRIPMMIDLG